VRQVSQRVTAKLWSRKYRASGYTAIKWLYSYQASSKLSSGYTAIKQAAPEVTAWTLKAAPINFTGQESLVASDLSAGARKAQVNKSKCNEEQTIHE